MNLAKSLNFIIENFDIIDGEKYLRPVKNVSSRDALSEFRKDLISGNAHFASDHFSEDNIHLEYC